MRLRRLLFIGLTLGLGGCAGPPYPDGDLDTLFPGPVRPTLQTVTIDGQPLHYALMPGPGKTPILFLHGSPGDWKAWAAYLKSEQLADMGPRIAVDRPGFGQSSPGRVMPDLRRQALLLGQLLPPGQPAIVVGHSLGGPLAAWLAIERPDTVCAAVIVAGSLSPQREAPRWYNTVAGWRVARPLIPQEMLDSNREIMALPGELDKLRLAWPRVRRPVVLVQGMRDMLVDPRTVEDVAPLIPARWLKVVRVADQGHFVLWKKPEVVMAAIRATECGTLSP